MEPFGSTQPALTEILGLLIPGSCWAFHTRIAVSSPGGNISFVSSDSGRRQSTPSFSGVNSGGRGVGTPGRITGGVVVRVEGVGTPGRITGGVVVRVEGVGTPDRITGGVVVRVEGVGTLGRITGGVVVRVEGVGTLGRITGGVVEDVGTAWWLFMAAAPAVNWEVIGAWTVPSVGLGT